MLSTLYIPVSGFALHPVVGITDERPTLRIASDEVGRILETPLTDLLTTAGPYQGYRWHDGRRVQVPYFDISGERVWGATAMVLAELLAVIGAPPKDPWEGSSLLSPVA